MLEIDASTKDAIVLKLDDVDKWYSPSLSSSQSSVVLDSLSLIRRHSELNSNYDIIISSSFETLKRFFVIFGTQSICFRCKYSLKQWRGKRKRTHNRIENTPHY